MDVVAMAINPSPGPEECGGGVVASSGRGLRSPPDGRENPATHQELPMPPSSVFANMAPPKMQQDFLKPKQFADTLPRTLSYDPTPSYNSPSKAYGGRGKDAKSEGSVRDKIAMFSSGKAPPPPSDANANSKYVERKTSLPAKIMDSNSSIITPRTTSQNRLSGSYNGESISKSYESLLDAPNKRQTLPPSIKVGQSPLQQQAKTSISYSNIAQENNRKSAVDVKIAPIEIRSIRAVGASKNDTDARTKSTIDQLIEQRRRSMTKLRGLVIPDSPSISNLPEIKSKDTMKINTRSMSSDKRSATLDHLYASGAKKLSPTSPLTPLWDSQSIMNNVPKYSPAFKRKPLQVYGPKGSANGENGNTLPANFRRSSVPSQCDEITSPRVKTFSSVDMSVDMANMKIMKAFSDAADSDNDSAVSSTQSSYLSTVSSPTPSLNTVDNSESDCSTASQKAKHVIQELSKSFLSEDTTDGEAKRSALCRSLSSDTSTSVGSSNSSTLTSGSQASCSSAGSSNADSHRILKPRSIEAINRKNILASAKCRSGKDNKFGSPLIERKFSDDSTDECGANDNKSNGPRKTNGDIVKYHNIKNRSLSRLGPDTVVKVAYSTLIEDKPPPMRSDDSEIEEMPMQLLPPQEKPPPVRSIKKYRETKVEEVAEKRTSQVNGNGIIGKARCNSSEDNSVEEECFEVRLSRVGGGGVGVILAGGVDCEAKEVTIHKVLQSSAADRDGRLAKGDKVVSINGHSMKGVSHAQSVLILKDPQPSQVCIVIRGKRPNTDVTDSFTSLSNGSSTVMNVELEKADTPGGAGLGISLEGGGNKPLLINKLFTGGAAFRSGKIQSGSELLAAGGTKLDGMTRTEAWGLLRALPPGPVTLVLRPP